MSGAARLRTVLATALACGGGAVLLPLGLRALLAVPRELWPVLTVGYLGGAALMTLGVAVTAWVALWPATPYLNLGEGEDPPRGAEPREARASLLAYPFRVATAGAGAGELAVVAGWLALTVAGQPAGLVLGLSLCTAALVGLSWLLLYAIAQRAAAPLLRRLSDAGAPPGHLLAAPTLRGRLSFSLFIVIAAGVVPAAVLGATYQARAADEEARAHGERLAAWLAQAGRGLSPRQAELLLESTPLSLGRPAPAAPLPGAQPQLALPLPGPGGRTYALPLRGEDERPYAMVIAVAALLALAGILAMLVGGAAEKDVYTLLAQVRGYEGASREPSSATDRPDRTATAEARPVEEALLRLMDRMRRLHVDSYLAIERTIDARRAKSQFLASMSHDLRSPLSSVLGFAELLSAGYEGAVPEPARRRLVRIHKTGRHLLRLLSEILDTAKVESQTIELHPRRCAPGEVLSQAISDARRGRTQEDIPVVLDVQPALRSIQVDPVRFPQALAHLIGHVLDSAGPELSPQRLRVYAREGQTERGPTFEVEIEVERSSLKDTDLDAVLPLGTVGLGLALPLARRLIALHGGTIEVTPGPRPCVRAIVPIKRSDAGTSRGGSTV